MERLNVLIVDDSRLAVQVLKSALEDLGHKVVRTAGTGAEAMTAYQACNPDVVTMDITMPDMDGIAATEKLVKSYPDARIIMVSSHAQQNMVMDALKAGAKGYILKPIQPDKLRDTLEQVAGVKVLKQAAGAKV
jgi:two-component system chemotaxis response regulator CheY